MTRLGCTLGFIAALAALLGNAAVAAAQEQAAPREQGARLERALIRVDIASPRLATVEAYLTFTPRPDPDAVGQVREFLLAWFPGQRLGGLEVAQDGAPSESLSTEFRARGTLQRLIVERMDAGAGGVRLRYQVAQLPDHAFRVPLPVIDATPSERSAVVITTLLPAGAEFGGDSFPDFVDTGRADRPTLRWESVAIPSFVHVVYAGVAVGTEAPVLDPVELRADVQTGGLGANFWGFFLFSAVWCVAYSAWALWRNRRERG